MLLIHTQRINNKAVTDHFRTPECYVNILSCWEGMLWARNVYFLIDFGKKFTFNCEGLKQIMIRL